MCKYVIVGKAASGKDWCQRLFVEQGYKPLRQYTTRPKRPNETGGEYHFVDEKKINRMKRNMKFASLKNFKGWYYGFTLEEFEKCDVAILSPGNISDLNTWFPNSLKFVTIIYLDIPMDIRKQRLSTRYEGGNEDDSVMRRINADEKDFENFKCFDIRFTHNDDATKYINKITHELNYN